MKGEDFYIKTPQTYINSPVLILHYMSSKIKTWQFSGWSRHQIHATPDLLRWSSMFNKRHDLGFFFSPQLYVPTYAKEFCIKQLQEGSLMGDTLTLPSWRDPLQNIYLWVWLVGKEWSLTESCPNPWKKGKFCTTYLQLNKVQLSFHQCCGEILLFLLYCFKEMKKKYFEKWSFILFDKYGHHISQM